MLVLSQVLLRPLRSREVSSFRNDALYLSAKDYGCIADKLLAELQRAFWGCLPLHPALNQDMVALVVAPVIYGQNQREARP